MQRISRLNEPNTSDSSITLKNSGKGLPEFREYVRVKYGVDLEEDLVIMIEDLIKRQNQKNR